MKKIRIALLCYTYEESDEQNKEKVSRLLKKVEDADFALPSGKIIKEETRRELSVHTFPPLDALIKRERS
ncbi:MAG: hypothetical protein KJ727_13345, partial [Acidobacteria bacterium]|nr:hypothetical protein [Acidobacteriota bacterium]